MEATGNAHIPADRPAGRKTDCAGTRSHIHAAEKEPRFESRWSSFYSPMSRCTSSADFTFGFDALVLVLSLAAVGRWMMVHNTGNESLKGLYGISFYRLTS